MKKLLYTLIALPCLISCGMIDIHESTFAALAPCHVESISAFANVDSSRMSGNSNVAASGVTTEWGISVFTYDSIVGWSGDESEFDFNFTSAGTYCKESIPEVEQYIHNLAEGRSEDSKPIGDVSWQAATRISCLYFPYRLEGVTALTITANQPFNGVEAGRDITWCFVVKKITPELIFSYDDYSVYSLESGKYVSVTEWLALRPLAAPCMHLRLRDDVEAAVNDIAFTVTMTLTDGKVLTSTTRTINIVD